jgi:hypothetical protein
MGNDRSFFRTERPGRDNTPLSQNAKATADKFREYEANQFDNMH